MWDKFIISFHFHPALVLLGNNNFSYRVCFFFSIFSVSIQFSNPIDCVVILRSKRKKLVFFLLLLFCCFRCFRCCCLKQHIVWQFYFRPRNFFKYIVIKKTTKNRSYPIFRSIWVEKKSSNETSKPKINIIPIIPLSLI